MIATLPEHISVREIAKSKGVSEKTVYRWITHGIGVNGVNVRLAATKAGGSVRVTVEALDKFDRECNPEPWRQAALQQEKERRESRRDRKKLKERLR